MLEIGSQSIFEVWNYSLTFSSFAVFAVFVVDMIGHKTKTMTTLSFTWAVLVGIIVGEAVLMLSKLYADSTPVFWAGLLSIASAVIVALMLQTKDPEAVKRRGRGGS